MTPVDPRLLLAPEGEDQVGSFMLMLALAFNDLRDAGSMLAVALKVGQESDPMSETYAVAAGRQWLAARQMMAISHETLELIKSHKGVVNASELATVLACLPADTVHQWEDIVLAASASSHTTKDGTPTNFRAWLKTVRNETTWHYAEPKRIAECVRDFFFTDPSTRRIMRMRSCRPP